jgi:crotonobetainyl-CoA:carnitine CoA-transferase CaiB-like acyl-CoA transferase
MGLDPDADGLATNTARAANVERTVSVVEDTFANWSADDLLSELEHVGVPAGRIRTLEDVYRWEQTASQGLLVEVMHPTLGAWHFQAIRSGSLILTDRRRRNEAIAVPFTRRRRDCDS